jgi:hypothetical protein
METEYIAPYILRGFVWEVLKKNLGMSDADYNVDGTGAGYIPIVPLGEAPELENFDKPYMVYGFAESQATHQRTAGSLMICVYSTKFREMADVANVIMKMFEDDYAVNEVNKYSSTIPAYIGLRFSSIQPSTLQGGTPEETQGGRMQSIINIRYEYFSEYDIDIKLAESTSNGLGYQRTS